MADPEIASAYRNAPAAKTLHHAYIGGLLDHVVSLCRSSELMCQNYPRINRDLLLTGAFLHDIGKIHELTYNRSFSVHDQGPASWPHDHRAGNAAGQARAAARIPR